jgi:hypothetical protein
MLPLTEIECIGKTKMQGKHIKVFKLQWQKYPNCPTEAMGKTAGKPRINSCPTATTASRRRDQAIQGPCACECVTYHPTELKTNFAAKIFNLPFRDRKTGGRTSKYFKSGTGCPTAIIAPGHANQGPCASTIYVPQPLFKAKV